MAERKPFLLRIDPQVLEALQRWAADELRSLNGQIEFVLRRTLQEQGRLPSRRGQIEDQAPRCVLGFHFESRLPGDIDHQVQIKLQKYQFVWSRLQYLHSDLLF